MKFSAWVETQLKNQNCISVHLSSFIALIPDRAAVKMTKMHSKDIVNVEKKRCPSGQ